MGLTLTSVVITMMISGVTINLFGVMMAVFWRREGVSLKDLLLAGSQAAAHPDQYVKSEHVVAIRSILICGVGLFLTGTLLIVYEAIQALWR